MEYYDVKIEVSADTKEQAERWGEKVCWNMPRGMEAYEVEVIDEDERHLEARIRYEENWRGQGEHYLLENRWSDEEWGLEIACPLVEDRIHYTALTKIREWQRLGIPFYFA